MPGAAPEMVLVLKVCAGFMVIVTECAGGSLPVSTHHHEHPQPRYNRLPGVKGYNCSLLQRLYRKWPTKQTALIPLPPYWELPGEVRALPVCSSTRTHGGKGALSPFWAPWCCALTWPGLPNPRGDLLRHLVRQEEGQRRPGLTPM